MDIRFLSQVDLSVLTACFNEAFSDYFVKFNATEEYLRNRWYSGRVDYDLSLGVYDGERMVGFLISGIDIWDGVPTAYNAGTGIIPAYRGKGIVGGMYEELLPRLRASGIRQSTLEVICQNERAIKAYQKAGFQIGRRLHCFKGAVKSSPAPDGLLFKRAVQPQWEVYERLHPFPWSWESTRQAVERMGEDIEVWEARANGEIVAYSIFHTKTTRLVQWGFPSGESREYGRSLLLHALAGKGELRVNNIDAGDAGSLRLFRDLGFEPTIDQFEMHRSLEDEA